MRMLLLALLVPIVLVGALSAWLQSANADLFDLNAARRVAFAEVRPAFLRFRADHARYPATLGELVPDYLDAIPRELQEGGFPEIKSGNISYTGGVDEAVFSYRSIHGPDGNASYDLAKDEYWQEQ